MKKQIRKLLVKYLFGKWWVKIGKRYEGFSRPGIFFLSFIFILAIMFILAFAFSLPILLLIAQIFTGIFTVSVLYFGFNLSLGGIFKNGIGYFNRYPVKWDELDDTQKWHLGQGILSGQLTKKLSLTGEQWKEYFEIYDKLNKKYFGK